MSHAPCRIARVAVLAAALFGFGCSSDETVSALRGGSSDDWPMYGRDLHRSFFTKSAAIDKSNVHSLKLAWKFPTTDAVTATPTVVNGVVYVGAWDGFFYALDAASGALQWKFQVDCQNTIVPVPPQCLAPGEMAPDRGESVGGLITSTATVEDGKVYFGAGKVMYCLDAQTGWLVWKRVLCGNPDQQGCENDDNDPNQIFSSPALYKKKLYLGTSVNGTAGYRGGILALDPATGATLWRFEVDPLLDASGNPILGPDGLPKGGKIVGCGNIWSSATIDELHDAVLFGTADCYYHASPPYHEALLALDAATGKLKWLFRPRMTDACDYDIGATANIVDMNGKRYVGVGSKDGSYYLLNSDPAGSEGEVVWSKNVVFGGQAGGFIASLAFDGRRVYGGTALGDAVGPEAGGACDPTNKDDTPLQNPSFHAFNVADGSIAWQRDHMNTFAPTSVVNDVVFDGMGIVTVPELQAFDADTGATIAELKAPATVNSGAAAVGKMLFFGSGSNHDPKGAGIYGYTLP